MKLLLKIASIIALSCSSCSNPLDSTDDSMNSDIDTCVLDEISIVDTVFVKMSSTEAFHKSINCKSINGYTYEYVIEDRSIALSLGYRPCAFCYTKFSQDSTSSSESNKSKKVSKNKIFETKRSKHRSILYEDKKP